MKKYEVLSAYSLMPLVVVFRDVDDLDSAPLEVSVKVDYRNDRVYFDSVPDAFDEKQLEKQILDYFKPPQVDIPDVFYEHLDQIREVKQASYASSFVNAYQNYKSPEPEEGEEK